MEGESSEWMRLRSTRHTKYWCGYHSLCPPRHSPAYIANYLKGKSARRILQRFPELRTRATREKLWSRSYFVATVGNVTADIVKKYVEEQWEKEK